MNELFCYEVTERLKARFDTTHQNFEVFQRVPLARRPTQSQWGSATPSRWLPLAPDSKDINLAAAAAALVAFRIGYLAPKSGWLNSPLTFCPACHRIMGRGEPI